MKKMNKMRFLAKTIISSFVLLAIFTACEVGLGSNVDTAAPKIEILSPEPSSTHKGEFQITGTASDEIAVRSISVNLLENGKARYSYNANYDAASGKWSVSIPTLDENNKPIVEDLKYEIQAIATDTDGKTSVATRSVQVDNSAPTVLVTSPSLFNENKSTFFRQLRVSGSAYDASEISSVKVYFYSMEDFQDGTSFDYAHTDKYVVYNAEGTNTWNLTKDLILSESTTESDKNVIDFFGNNEEYHFFVVAEDIAGNKNTYFYRMGDFYSKGIISDTTNDGDNYIPFPSMVQIGKFDQGEQVENPTSGLTAEGLEQIKIECDNLELNDSNFLYRSESVPSVSWGNIEFADGVPRAIPRETDITGQIKTSDTTDILPTSIEVLLASGPNEPSEDDWWVLDEKYVTLDPFGTSASFNIVLKKDGETLKSGNYFIKIKYKTVASINNSDSLESNPQPFEISEGLPVLTETKMLNNGTSPVSAEMYTSKESVTLGGKAQKGDGTPVDKIFIKENDKEIPSPKIGANGEWELTRTEEGSYRFEIEIQSGNDKTTISRTVIIDRTSPAIENMSFDQSADRKTVTLRAFISDDNSFKEIYYAFVKGSTKPSEEDWKVPEEKKNSLNIVIKPSEGKEFEQGPWTMWIKASDPAGNEKIEKYSGILDLESPKFSDNFKSTAIPENGYLNKDFYYVAADLSDDVVLATDNYEISKIEIVAKKDGEVSNLSETKAINKKELKKSDIKDLPVIESIAGNEGKWIITFTLYDLNSNKVEKTLDFSMDITKPTVSIEKVPQAEYDNTSPFEFRGTASDDVSGVDKIFISLDKSLDKEKWPEIEGIKSWGKELEVSQGNGTIYAYAVDGAGNESEIVEKAFTFDESKPEIKVTTNSGNSQWATGKNFSLEGSASDTWKMGATPIVITQKRGNEEVILSSVIYDSATKGWKVEGLPRNENNETIPEEKITTGNYVYTIKATDIVGKESKTVVTVQIDKDAPTVPEVISPNGNVGINAIAATTYKFQGNTQETGESATGVKQVEYLISENATSPESGTILPSTGSWNFTDDFTQADEGKKYLHIRAEDDAGNKSDWKTVEFDVDFSSPTVELPTFKDKQNTLFTLSGTAKDTKGLASANSVVIIQRDSEGNELLVATTITDDSWTTITLPVKATNESVTEAEKDSYNDTYTYEIKATDWCGKTTVVSKTVNFDTKAPEIEVKNLKEGDFLTSTTITISGTVNDSSKIKGISYQITGKDEDLSTWKTIENKTSWNIPQTEFEKDLSETEGAKVLHLKVEDELGNATTEKINFTVDTKAPEISLKTPDTTETIYINSNGTVTLQGEARDAIGFKHVEIKLGTKTLGTVKIDSEEKWTCTIAGSDLASDVSTNVIITAIDDAGHTSSLPVFNVYKDTKKPDLVLKNIDNETIITEQDLKDGKFTIKGSWNDNGGSGLSGDLSKLEYKLNSGNWTTISTTNSEWSQEITLTEGKGQTISFKATDAVGNEQTLDLKEILIDLSLPTITTSVPEELFTNKEYTLSGTASDALAIDDVKVFATKDGKDTQIIVNTEKAEDGKSLTWSFTVKEEGCWKFDIKATDKAERESVVTKLTVNIDKTSPSTPTVYTPAEGTTGLSSITSEKYRFSGTTSDEGNITTGIGAIKYAIQTEKTTPTTLETVPSSENWNFEKELTEGKYYLYVKSVDNAGNESDYTIREFDVDYSNPTLKVEGIEKNQKSLFKLNITEASDTKELKTLEITQTSSDGTSLKLEKSGKCSIDLPLKNTETGVKSVTEEEKDSYNDTYTYEIKATDWCGKTTTITKTVNFDTVAPKIEVQNLTSGTYLNADKIDVRGSVNDESKISGFYWVLDGNPSVPSNVLGNWAGWTKIDTQNNWIINLSGMNDGNHTLKFAAVDAQGNVSETTEINFSTDITPPTLDDVIDTEPVGTYLKKGISFSFANIAGATVAKDNYELSRYEIIATKDGKIQTGANSPINYWYKKELSGTEVTQTELNDIPVLESKEANNGAWKFTIAVYDKAGNKAETTRSFTVDATNPELTSIDVYPKAEEDRTSPFTFKGKASDRGLSSLSEVKVSLDKNTWTTAIGTKEWNCELAIPTEGEGVVYAKAIDGAGNESAIVEQAFVFDKSHPSVTVTTNSGNPEWATGTTYSLEGTAEDSWLMSEDSPVTITQTRGTEKVTLTGVTGVDYNATAKTWKVEGLPRKADNSTIASGEIETGTYVYTIVAKDKAGKTSEKTVTVQIDKDAPTVPEVISPNGNLGINAIAVKTYRFQGKTEDIGSSATGVKQVEYKISEISTPETSGTTILASSGSWNFTQDFEEGKEGKKYLHIRSEDNAGNKSGWKTVEFDVDFSAPEVKVSENFKGNEKAIFTLSGTASDTKGLASANSVVITQRDSAGKALEVTSTVTGNSWESQTLPVVGNGKSVEAGKEADYNGTYTYEIKATDWCGKTTTITKTVNFDTIAPELDIKNLKDGEFLAQEEIIIQGTVRDSSKIDAVYYQTTGKDTQPDSAKWTKIVTQNSWQIPLEKLSQGEQVLHLKAVDELENGNDKVTSVSFTVDTVDPIISVDKEDGKTYYTKDGITVSGTAEDAISLKQVDIKRGATTLATIKASEIGEDKKWSYKIEAKDLTSDIATNVIISAVDDAGHVKNAPVFNVYKDTKVPTLVLNNIATGTIITEQDLKDGKFTVKGSWNDNGGSGYAKLEYCLDAETSDSTEWTEVKVNNAVPGSTWNFPITLEETLNQTLNIRVTDTVGNSSVTSLNNIIVDKSAPIAGTTTLDNQYIGKDDPYKLEGTATDSLGLAKIEIKSSKKGEEPQTDVITVPNGEKSFSWSKVLEPTSDVETWSYSIIAYDVANHASVVETRTVFVDKKAPKFGTIQITTEKAYEKRDNDNVLSEIWYNDNVLSIEGTLTEDTGIKELKFSTDNSTWTNFYREQNGKNYTFSGTISINEEWKDKTIYIKAVDTLDNETEETKITGINVDRNNPTVTINESIVCVNASTKSLSISVEPSDSGSGVKAVRAKINEGDYEEVTETDGTYTISLDVEDLKNETGTITVEVEDNVGKTGHATVQYEKDIVLPEVEITSHSNGNSNIVNKKIILKGSTTESQGLAKVEIFVDGSDTASKIFEGNAGFNWSYEIDTTKIYNDIEIKDLPIKVVATDNAGNESKAQEITLKIDQKSDRPEITLNNVSSGEDQYLTDTMILGVISDDDGPITALKIAVKPKSGEIDWSNIENTSVTKAGSFGFILSGDDDKTELCFQVEANGATFETGKSLLEQPKIMDVDEKEVENGLVVFNLDTNTPDINTENTKLIFGDNPEGEIFANNIQVGGKRKEFDLKVQASDGNGIKEVTLEVEGISDPYKLTPVTPDGENWKRTVDTTAIENGLKTFKITVVDNAGTRATLSKQILVDKQAPSIDIESHTIGETVLGKTRISGTTTDDIDGISGSGIKSVKWLVAKDTVLSTKTSDDDIIDLFINPTVEEKNNIKTYSVKGTLSWNYSFGDNNDNLGELVTNGYGSDIGSEIYELPIFFLIEDNVGNQKLEKFRLNVDPNGDKPRPSVSYPSDGEKLGGTIRINGTTEIAEGTVEKVYIQLGSLDDETGKFKPFTKDAFDTWFTKNGCSCPYTFDTIEDETVIEATGTAAWNITINENKEFNLGSGFTGLVEKDDLSYVLFRVRAKNTEDKLGAWTELITISLDKKVPEISNPRLVKYNGDKEIASKDYISGDWISGNDWNLVTTVKDENGLISIKLTEVSENAKIDFNETTAGPNEEKEVKIPLKTNTFEGNNFSFILSATDGSTEQNNSEKLISLKFDNNGPELEPLEHGGKEIDKETNPIEQDNNGFDISSSITEKNNGSDLEHILLYFKDDTHEDKYYVPMVNEDGKSVLSQWTGSLNNEGLPSETLQVSRGDERTIKVTGINKFIKAGGVVRIGNMLCRIEKVDSSTEPVTVTIDTDVPENFNEAEFIYALVIDNINGGEYIDQDGELENDDGDGFEEKLSLTGSTYDWSVVINSKEIPDGPVTMYCLAYDKAGNCSTIQAQETMVQNNRPAIAKVWLGTDLNGDNAISSNEEVLYREDETRETADGSVTLMEADFTAKGRTSIRPEIVGGNGNLYYYKDNTVSEDNKTLLKAGKNDEIAEDNENAEDDEAIGEPDETIYLELEDNNTTLEGKYDTGTVENSNETETFTFKIWDSTPGLTPGDNSLSATITVSMKIDVVDGVAPTVVIEPLYWDSKTDNSLYQNSTANGHIDLSADLPETFKEKDGETVVTGVKDRDDKVSGKITFTGTAYDDVRLGSLDFTFDEFSDTITFDNSDNQWSSVEKMDSDGYVFTAETDSLDQGGHKVNWTLSIDTAKIEDVAATDVNLTVSATDKGSNSSSTVESEDKTNVPSYKVDVVPYITGIERTATTNSTESTYRSKFGNYTAAIGDTLTVTGFNFSQNPLVKVGSKEITEKMKPENTSFTMSIPGNSGELTITVNGIESLNHKNNNDVEYNRENDSKDSVTDNYIDNRYLYVWDINHRINDIPTTVSKTAMGVSATGQIYSQYVRSGDGQVMFIEGLAGNEKQIFRCYDQTQIVTGIGVDTKSSTTTRGGTSTLFFMENVGNSATMDYTSSAMTDVAGNGGVAAISMTNEQVKNNVKFEVDNDVKKVKIANNPYLRLDSSISSSFYPLQSYSMKREQNLFSVPHSAKYGTTMHNIWYDLHTKGLKYSYVDSGYTEEENPKPIMPLMEGSMVDWVVIDGGYNGQDRVHPNSTQSFSDGQYVLSKTTNNNNTINTNRTANSIKDSGQNYGAAYEYDLFGLTPTNKSATSCRVTVSNYDGYWKDRLKKGATIAFLVNGTTRTIALSKITNISANNNTLTLTYDSCADAVNANYVTIYTGNYNVVGLDATVEATVKDIPSSSAGKYSAIDVTTQGYPCIAYFDAGNATVKVAYATDKSPTLASDWERIATGANGGTHVSMCIDNNNVMHISYRDSNGKLVYQKGEITFTNSVISGITFSDATTIDENGSLTYGTISVVKHGDSYRPCVSYLNSEETDSAIKYATLITLDGEEVWDYHIVPAVKGRYAVSENTIQVAGNSGEWSEKQDSVDLSYCSSLIGYLTEGMDVVFLKSENIETTSQQ